MMIIGLFLRQNSSIRIVRSIGFHSELFIRIGVDEYRSLTNSQFEELEGVLLVLGPLPRLILLEEIV